MLVAPPLVSLNSPASHLKSAKNKITLPVPSQFAEDKSRVATAIVYCEANFGEIDGKTANGLIRRSEKYKILSVVDSEKVGLDTGMLLDNKPNAIPICLDLAGAQAQAGLIPDLFIFGMEV